MDLKQIGWGALFAFLAGAGAIVGPVLQDGFQRADLSVLLGAGVVAVLAYAKDPRAHRGPDPRK